MEGTVYICGQRCMKCTNINLSDTGYRAIPEGTKPDKQHDAEYLDTLPHCPVFKGKTYKGS